MSYQNLEDVTGVGKSITIRNKQTGVPFKLGLIEGEVSKSDGEQKYFIQQIHLEFNVSVDGDATRYVYRIGYYTRRTDGRLCLGSQFSPILTPSELQNLFDAIVQEKWLKED